MSDLIDRLISTAEAGVALGVADRTIRWWIQTGKITSHKLGEPGCRAGRRLIPVSEVNRIIEESRVPARVAAAPNN